MDRRAGRRARCAAGDAKQAFGRREWRAADPSRAAQAMTSGIKPPNPTGIGVMFVGACSVALGVTFLVGLGYSAPTLPEIATTDWLSTAATITGSLALAACGFGLAAGGLVGVIEGIEEFRAWRTLPARRRFRHLAKDFFRKLRDADPGLR